MFDPLGEFVENLVLGLPVLLVLMLGLGVAVVRYEKYPSACGWAILGFGWQIGVNVVAAAWHPYILPELFPIVVPLGFEDRHLFAVLAFLESLGYVFLLAAIFAHRRDRNRRRYLDDLDDPHSFD